jgi:hypothetical protein
MGTAARSPTKAMKPSRQQQIYPCLAYEATLRKIGALASSATVDLKSAVEHVDLHFTNTSAAAVHVYSIETDYLETTNITGSTEHHFSISVRVDGQHYAADVFIGELGEIRWNGEIAEFQDGVPLRSFRMNVVPAPW